MVQLFINPDYKGGPLIVLDQGDCVRPSAATLAKNYVWLLPMVKDSPKSVGAENSVRELV